MRTTHRALAALPASILIAACAASSGRYDAEDARAYRERQCHPVIEGRVVDTMGRAVPGATIVVVEERSSIDRRRPITDADGRYRLEYVNLGCPVPKSVSLLVCARGFEPRKVTSAEADGKFRFDHILEQCQAAVGATEDAQFQRECVRLARAAPARSAASRAQDRVPPTIAPPHTMTAEEHEARRRVIEKEMADTRSKLSALEQSGGSREDRTKLEKELEISRLTLQILDSLPRNDGSLAKTMMETDLKLPGVKAYLSRWAKYIRRVGEDYLANDGSNGRVQVAVTIARDGSLRHAEITRSSGEARLDAVALAVLRHAKPFEPFPAEMGNLAEIHAISTLQFEPAKTR